MKRQTRFTSKRPAKEIVQKIATTASAAGFTVATRNYKVAPGLLLLTSRAPVLHERSAADLRHEWQLRMAEQSSQTAYEAALGL